MLETLGRDLVWEYCRTSPSLEWSSQNVRKYVILDNWYFNALLSWKSRTLQYPLQCNDFFQGHHLFGFLQDDDILPGLYYWPFSFTEKVISVCLTRAVSKFSAQGDDPKDLVFSDSQGTRGVYNRNLFANGFQLNVRLVLEALHTHSRHPARPMRSMTFHIRALHDDWGLVRYTYSGCANLLQTSWLAFQRASWFNWRFENYIAAHKPPRILCTGLRDLR